MEDPNLTDEEIIAIGTRYHVAVDPDDVTHYKLCRAIHVVEQKLQDMGGTIPDFTIAEKP